MKNKFLQNFQCLHCSLFQQYWATFEKFSQSQALGEGRELAVSIDMLVSSLTNVLFEIADNFATKWKKVALFLKAILETLKLTKTIVNQFKKRQLAKLKIVSPCLARNCNIREPCLSLVLSNIKVLQCRWWCVGVNSKYFSFAVWLFHFVCVYVCVRFYFVFALTTV